MVYADCYDERKDFTAKMTAFTQSLLITGDYHTIE